MSQLTLMILALTLIILLRFVSDQSAIRNLAAKHGISQLTARGIFRAEIYNAMAANKGIALLFLLAVGYAIWMFVQTGSKGMESVLMSVLTVILAMEIGRYITRKDADTAIAQRIAARKASLDANKEQH